MNPYLNNGPHCVARFPSLTSMVRWAEKATAPNWQSEKASHGSGRDYGKKWSGTDTFSEAVKLADEGWPEGMRLMKQITDKEPPIARSPWKKVRYGHGISGVSLDVGRYLGGEPEHFYRLEEDPRKHRLQTKVANLHLELSANSWLKGIQLLQWGVGLTAVIDILEQAGMSIGLTLVMKTETYNASCTNIVDVKTPGQPMDIGQVLFALGNPAFYRRLFFSVIENQPVPPQILRQFYHGYGRAECSKSNKERGEGLYLMGLETVGNQADTATGWRDFYLKVIAGSAEFHDMRETLEAYLQTDHQ